MMRRRYRQLLRLWRDGGSREIIHRVRRAAANRLMPAAAAPLAVRPADVLAADLGKLPVWSALPLAPGQPMILNWVMTPPVRRSGGHTTIFRIIAHLERSGHVCRIYIYDVHGNDGAYFRNLVAREFPHIRAPAFDVLAGMDAAHAVIATSWQTAYPAYNDGCAGKRFYLVQDFEPWFYPVSGPSALAENTYRMGFHAITAGRFLAQKLSADFGMAADAFDFGCETDTYRVQSGNVRDGIVFYAKPEVPRRAYEIGVMALQIFAQRHPQLVIHCYGGGAGQLPFRCIDHGVITPDELNRIYNRCYAGLCLSMTNASLVPHEMLAAGCIPVVNEAPHNRIVLDNPFIRYALPTPHALAATLDAVVAVEDFAALAAAASASVSSMSWEAAGASVEQALRRALSRHQAAPATIRTASLP